MESYLERHRKVLELEKAPFDYVGKKRAYPPFSVARVVRRVVEDARTLITFGIDVVRSARYFPDMRSLRKSGITKSALVLGNGPSISTLSRNWLEGFLADGNSLFVVNYFNEVDRFVGIRPTYWVLSDPHNEEEEGFEGLLQNLQEVKPILIVPSPHKSFWQLHLPCLNILTFCDLENVLLRMPWQRGIRPDRPRSYASLTLLKALSIAIWCGFERTYVLGMDNTYPHNVFVDDQNTIWEHVVHAYGDAKIVNRSAEYKSLADYLFEVALVLHDTKKFFSGLSITNLDSRSLTDAFEKSSLLQSSELD